MPAPESIYEDNLRLSQIEYQQQHIYLRSQPRFLGLVLGNACNIYCPHCYQSKNGDNLLKPAAIGRELRREFMGLYPYLSTLRIQGGEAMAYTGFSELIEDVAATAARPMLSMSTNGTLIGEEWAERIVRLPFRNVTVSIDGGTPATYARLRRGADLDAVMANVDRIQRWKRRLASELPRLDSFFVVMRSNFREIPQYLDLMSQHGFEEVALQTAEINAHNTAREPNLAADESIAAGGRGPRVACADPGPAAGGAPALPQHPHQRADLAVRRVGAGRFLPERAGAGPLPRQQRPGGAGARRGPSVSQSLDHPVRRGKRRRAFMFSGRAGGQSVRRASDRNLE